jgi:hypothetical protein
MEAGYLGLRPLGAGCTLGCNMAGRWPSQVGFEVRERIIYTPMQVQDIGQMGQMGRIWKGR